MLPLPYFLEQYPIRTGQQKIEQAGRLDFLESGGYKTQLSNDTVPRRCLVVPSDGTRPLVTRCCTVAVRTMLLKEEVQIKWKPRLLAHWWKE